MSYDQGDGRSQLFGLGGQGRRYSNGIKLLPIIIGVVALVVFYFSHKQEGPFGRSQLVGMNSQEEMALGAQSFREVLKQSDVIREGPVVESVQRLARQLTAASQQKDVLEFTQLKPVNFEWETRVVRSREVNAFCLPGGKIVVYTGILPVAETESCLAAVMGHEISHALCHHGAERMAQNKMVQIGQMAAAGAAGDMDPQRQQQILGVLGAGAKLGFLLPFSREHESEADHIGLILMAAAGHDPKKAVVFWQRMQKASKGGKPSEFMSTHPSDERRISDLEGLQEEAMQFYNRAPQKQQDRKLPIGMWDRGF